MEKDSKISKEVLAQIEEFAKGMVRPRRSPILKTPGDYGMEYEEVFFSSMDGVPLEAWFIPADSDKLIICNHPGTMNRYGFPGHLEPWSQFSDIEVNFLKVYEALHRAGYNVLTYDMRNHGASGAANDGVCGYGLYEWRDVVGAMQYVQGHHRMKDMSVGLYNQCAGGNAAIIAMSRHPEYFKDVKAFICPQPCSGEYANTKIARLFGLGDYLKEIDFEQVKLGGFRNKELSPHPYVKDIKVPTFIIQVREDAWTEPCDVQTTFDLIPGGDKKLFWIEGTTCRFDGYNYFGEHPEMMIQWFDKYMK